LAIKRLAGLLVQYGGTWVLLGWILGIGLVGFWFWFGSLIHPERKAVLPAAVDFASTSSFVAQLYPI